MRFWFICLAAVLAGCAAQPQKVMLYKDGGTQSEYQQAIAQCDYEVSVATQQTDYSLHSIFGQELDRSIRQRDLGIKCMAAKGWVQR